MREQGRIFLQSHRKRFPVAFGEGLATRLARCLGLHAQYLPRKVVEHAAKAGKYLVAEQGVVGRRQEMAQNWLDARECLVAAGKRGAQIGLAPILGPSKVLRHHHSPRVAVTWLIRS